MDTIFIVRPFGSKRPVIKKNKDGVLEIVFFDFDKVENDLIVPAMNAAGLQGGTTQRIFEAGEIKEDMFSALLLSDIVIADITIHNANVFYELGIRHALRKKTTILIRCDGFDETPFDITGYKYITYQKDDPAASLQDLIRFFHDSTSSQKKDSPVFNMLPLLVEQETEKLIAIPDEFGDEVVIATDSCQAGKLKLLAMEAMSFPWEMQASRYLGESFFDVKAWEDCRETWEHIKEKNRNDFQANDRLSTVYQRLADIAADTNPDQARALLRESDLANEIILKNYKDLDNNRRAEIFSLKGRNAKTRWVNEWENLPDDKREKTALLSPNLETAYENYEAGYFENLNHYYSGINALSLLVIIITLSKRYPGLWESVHDEDDDKWTIERLEKKLVELKVSLQFSLEAEKRRQLATGVKDAWTNITGADFVFLTTEDPLKVSARYTRAVTDADNRHIESAKKQLMLFSSLNILPLNVKAALDALPEKTDTPENIHYLLFAGHLVDKPGRTTPRFPPTKEAAVKQQMLDKVKEVIDAQPGFTITGIAGGASGGDIIFHEACKQLGVRTELFLAIPRMDYVVESVNFAGASWINRFNAIYMDANIKHFELSDKNELPAWLQKKKDYTVWERGNLWQLNSALVNGGANMTLIALWDGKGGDGPGGTEHMVNETKARGGKVIVIDINTL